jgi:VWFA-related protein
MRARSVLIPMLLAVAPAAAQTQPAENPRPVQAFEESIDVRVVNLEAVVTDARGKRVPGLALGDFRLFVDGVETPITFFSEIEEKTRRAPGEAATGVETAAEPTWQSRNILVFLDEVTMLKARRDFVMRSLVKQLDDLSPGDQMAVVAFAGRRLEVLCDWTGDRARLASALTAAEARPAEGIRAEVARRSIKEDAELEAEVAAILELSDLDPWVDRHPASAPPIAARGPQAGPALLANARPQETLGMPLTQLFNPLDRFLEVAEAAAGAMRGLPAPSGRKMLMLLTEGFQYPYFARPVIREANRLGYSLYPVDVKGLDTFLAQNDVEKSGPSPFYFVTTDLDRGIDHTLQTMAAATGGQASLNSNRLAALGRLVEDSSSYYFLGFSPTWRGDDRRHKIALAVARPGLTVRTRDSYDDASRRTRLTLEAGAMLLLGRSRSEPRLIVTVGEPAAAAGKTAIPVSLGVPVESLAFVPREQGFHAEAPVAVVVLDAKGKRQEMPAAWLQVDVPQLPSQGTYAKFDFPLAAGSKARRIVVTVHDALSGEALWGEARLEPPAR